MDGMETKTDIKKIAEQISTRNDLINFLNLYYKEFLNHPKLWKTEELEAFFESMSAATLKIGKKMERAADLNSGSHPTWRTVAEILLVARDVDPKSR